jgi:hypothetical protein
MNKIKMIPGIDSLYYFIETNDNYDSLFLDILNQIEDNKTLFNKNKALYKNKDIKVEIKKRGFEYLNNSMGFYWFKDIEGFFRVGFKDEQTNATLNNIWIQLQSDGIYSIGIKALLELINDFLFKEVSKGSYPVNRIDLNCFINYNFSFVDKTMFATRKRSYAVYGELGNHKEVQTVYVGKKPFLLRLYNKSKQLKETSKNDVLMFEHFANNGLDVTKTIYNIEFEMHRQYLKSFGVTELYEILKNAQNLFKKAMDDIRLIDISNITQKDIENNSKSRAKTHPLWQEVKNRYKVESFLQARTNLERIKRKAILYDDINFKDDFIALCKKGMLHGVTVFPELASHYCDIALNPVIHAPKFTYKKQYTEVEVLDKDGCVTHRYRLLKSGELITPVQARSRSKDE